MSKFEFHLLTPERWNDLEILFGKNGACGGCWCMFFRIKRADYEKKKGEGNRKAIKKLVDSRELAMGIIGYVDGKPAGWVSFGRREEFPVVENSRLFKRIDELPVWSIVCFFVARPYRRKGITGRLLKAAIRLAQEKGARIIEAYPVDPRKGEMPDVFVYHGLASIFRKAGFKEVIRRSETRPMMRKELR